MQLPHPVSAEALLASPVRRRIVDVIAAAQGGPVDSLGSQGLTASQVGKIVDLHVTTARFHLDQLVSAGVLTASFHKHVGAGRPRKVYAVPPSSPPPPDSRQAMLLLTSLLTQAYAQTRREQRVVSPDEAGLRWAHENVPASDEEPASTPGQFVGKVGRLIDVLQRWGYDPDIRTSEGGRSTRLDLHDCPFRDLAREDSTIVCGIHRGLIAGTMEQLGEPDTDVSLQPFAKGNTCIAHLQRARPFDTTETAPAPRVATHQPHLPSSKERTR